MDRIVTITMNPAIDRILEVPGFQIGGHQKGRLLERVPAGKGLNVSQTLAVLDVPSIATGFVGETEREMYEKCFQGTCVKPQFLTVAGTTRENITIIDPETNVETHVRAGGITTTPAALDRLRNKISLLAKEGNVMIFAGSLPPGVEIDYAVGLIDLMLAKKARVVIDGPGELLRAVRDRKLWLIKPNLDELAVMHEREKLTDSEAVDLGRTLSQSTRTVMVTCGSAGAYLFIEGAAFLGQVDIAASAVRSAVGCGDAMLGGFIAAQHRGDNVKKSFVYALAIASATATNDVPGHFDPACADDLLSKTNVEAVTASPATASAARNHGQSLPSP